jgi:hypothetical protein
LYCKDLWEANRRELFNHIHRMARI